MCRNTCYCRLIVMATSISFLLLYPCSVIRFLPCLLTTLIGEISCFDGATIRVNVACHPVTFNLKITVASQIALEPKYQRSPHLSYVDFATIMLVYQKWGSVEISEPFKAVLVIAFKSQHYDMLISNQEMKHEIIRPVLSTWFKNLGFYFPNVLGFLSL